ncbi:MAG: DNA primase, partial [Candidatus Pelagibacter sp.]|nr:DNA primase [Candidatus Pelagibacter sp.]
NDPSSMAIFEKKLRSVAATIKDDFIKKYVLEFFLEKISSLTPHSNIGKKQFYIKKVKSLDSTKKHFNESKSISGVEIKEFSLLYLIMNNLDIIQENIHLIEDIKLFSAENKLIFESLLSKLKSGEKLTLENLSLDSQIIEKIFKFASIKHILNNNQDDQNKMFELLDEISKDLKNYDLEFRIEQLESKFSKDLSESTFDEIRELKKQKNIN